MCPAQAFTSDKMVLVLLCGVPLHWLYRSTASENHRFCLIETTLGNIRRNYTQYNLQSFSVVPSYSLIKWTQDLRNIPFNHHTQKVFPWRCKGTRHQRNLTRHRRDQSEYCGQSDDAHIPIAILSTIVSHNHLKHIITKSLNGYCPIQSCRVGPTPPYPKRSFFNCQIKAIQ